MWTGRDQHISVPRCVAGLTLFLSKRLLCAKSMDVVQVVGDGWVRGIPRHRLRQGVGWREGVRLPRLCGAKSSLGKMPHRLLPLREARRNGQQHMICFRLTRKSEFEAFKRSSLQYWWHFLHVCQKCASEMHNESSTTELRNSHNSDWRRRWFI